MQRNNRRTFTYKWYVFRRMGFVRWFHYFVFQKVLRMNGTVPWPVHCSSIVTHPERIEFPLYEPPSGNLHFPGALPGQYIQGNGRISIGRNFIAAMGCKIISGNHDLCDYERHVNKSVEIGDDCWMGANSIILPGVRLGNHVVVAAGAVVAKSFGDNCVIGGIPAVKLRDLPSYNENAKESAFSLSSDIGSALKRRFTRYFH